MWPGILFFLVMTWIPSLIYPLAIYFENGKEILRYILDLVTYGILCHCGNFSSDISYG